MMSYHWDVDLGWDYKKFQVRCQNGRKNYFCYPPKWPVDQNKRVIVKPRFLQTSNLFLNFFTPRLATAPLAAGQSLQCNTFATCFRFYKNKKESTFRVEVAGSNLARNRTLRNSPRWKTYTREHAQEKHRTDRQSNAWRRMLWLKNGYDFLHRFDPLGHGAAPKVQCCFGSDGVALKAAHFDSVQFKVNSTRFNKMYPSLSAAVINNWHIMWICH